MRRKLYVFFVISAFSLFFQTQASIVVNTIELKKTKPENSFFTGEVLTPRSEVFGFDIPGKIISVKQLGEYVCDSIYKDNGKLIRKGTVIASLSKKRYQYNVNIEKMNIEIAESSLKAAKSNLIRARKLIESKAISQREYEKYNVEYVKAKLNLSQHKIELKKAQSQLKSCDMIAPFSGIVEKVYAAPGSWVNSDKQVIRLSRINPLVVRIKLPKEIIKKISKEDFINVYPPFSDKPVPTWTSKSMIDGTMYAFICNSMVFDRKQKPGDEKAARVSLLFPVSRITAETSEFMGLENIENPFGSKIPLAIPTSTIKKDKKGTYVVRVKDVTAFGLKKGMPDEFNVEKVYVKLGDISREFFLEKGYTLEVKTLADPGKLKINDILVASSRPKILKDGQRVIYGRYYWKFYPGQIVKVEIPLLTPEAFYVPRNAVIDKAFSEKYLYLVKGNKIKSVKVKIVGIYDNYYAIEGEGLKDGDQAVVLDEQDEYGRLFEGCEVIKKNIMPPVLHLK